MEKEKSTANAKMSNPSKDDTKSRDRHHTEKGQAYFLETKTKRIKTIIKQLNEKTEVARKCMVAENDQTEILRKCYRDWMVCYEDYLTCRNQYKSLLTDTEEDAFKENDFIFLSFKAEVESHFQRLSSEPIKIKPEVYPSDSASQIDNKQPSRVGSQTSMVSISSAKLREAQRKAEINMKLQTLQKRRQLELFKVDLKAKEEQLELDTELAICIAKTKILEDLDNFSQASKHSGSNLSQSKFKSEVVNDYPSILRADAPMFNPNFQHQTEEVNYALNYVQPSTTNDKEQSEFYRSNNEQFSTQVFYNRANETHRTQNSPVLKHPASEQINHQIFPLRETDVSNLYPTSPDTRPTDIECVVRQLRKPTPDIQKFAGSALEYKRFMRQFHAKVISNCDNYEEKLNYLEQYTIGEAQKIVSGYGYLDAEIGYKAALNELDERYGSDEAISNAFVKRALDWPTVKPDDAKGLDQFGIFLAECDNAIKSIESVKVLEYPDNLKKLVGKLPYFLHGQWRTIVQQTRQKSQLIKFGQLVQFVKSEASKANDPTYGKDALRNETKPGQIANKGYNRNQSSGTRYKTSFAINVQDKHTCTDTESQSVKYTKRSTNVTPQRNEDKQSALVPPCMFCNNSSHSLDQCDSLYKLPYQERMDFLKGKQLCFGCLKYGHRRQFCRNKAICKHCEGRHPSICHVDGDPPRLQQQTFSKTTNPYVKPNPTSACANVDSPDGECTMSIIPVTVMMKNGMNVLHTYAFLDPGSSASFCTEDILKRLGGSGKPMKITIDTMGTPHTMTTFAVQGLVIGDIHMQNFIPLPKVFTKEKMPVSFTHVPTENDLQKWPHLKDISLPTIDSGIDLLIGNDVADAYTPLECRTGPRGSPHATRSLLGWIPWNVIRPGNENINVTVNRTNITTMQDIQELNNLNKQIQTAIMMDFPEHIVNDKREYSMEDKRFIQKVNASIQLENGHYSINLPFRNDNVKMPNNEVQARHRLQSLKTKMSRNKTFNDDYRVFMHNILDKGYAERVPNEELHRADGKTWYIPHHGVYHPQKPGKIRVVFDCSAKFAGVSLNDVLLQGPNLTNNLLSVLLQFREENVALMSDIESMYYQVRVPKTDCDMLRFLWWPDGNTELEPETYRMLVHLFGAASSPSCAVSALLKTATDNSNKFDNEVSDVIHRNFYVDDCLKATDSESNAIKLIKDVTAMCHLGGFKLTKWITNNRNVLETIPEEEKSMSVRNLELGHDQLPVERAFGVYWSTERDTLGFRIKEQDKPTTRRGILSAVSSIYDPLGLASPFVLKAKIILQELCRKGITWDEEVTGEEAKSWLQWTSGLSLLATKEVPRCFKPLGFGKTVSTQVNVFSDASESGYGVVIYLRLSNTENQHHCSLIMAKSRVTPLKRVSIPRLELTAATVAVRLTRTVIQETNLTINQVYYWTDSMPVLRYIANESTRFHTFVSNRLAVIHDGTEPHQWNYVPSTMNPADCASRGLPIETFVKQEDWFRGPLFLWKPKSHWPQPDNETSCRKLPQDDPEVKKVLVSTTTVKQPESVIESLVMKHSGWLRLRSAVGWLLLAVDRFKNLKRKDHKDEKPSKTERQSQLKNTYLPMEKIQQAENILIQHEQRCHFSKEINALSSSNETKRHVLKSSSLNKLDPVMINGILRVGGRLDRAATPYEVRHPIIMPKNSRLSHLILEFTHKCVGHLGKNTTLAALRQTFWILGAGASIKKLTGKCVTCRKYRAKVLEQKMADLPPDRITQNQAPFSGVAMDYFGPFEIHRARSIVKRYGVVFTCLTSRAVHLEIAHSLTTDSCINAIRRLIARRGPVSLVRSDNGTNLVGSERELREALNNWNQQQIHSDLQKKNIKWIFNPPAASHQGGVWERMIRTIRKVLYSIMKEQTIKLDDEGLGTFFCEAESIINGRPITEVSSDVKDLDCLTPNHLLLMRTGEQLPPGNFQRSDVYAKQRWKEIQYLADLFWKRWTREYLPLLQTRQKWHQVRRNIQVNDIVLVVDNAPRNTWCLARVLEVNSDRHGLVPSAKVKTKSACLVRPVNKLCLILENDTPS